MRHALRCALLAALLLTPALASADEIADAIAEAARAYRAGDLAATREALGEATQFLAQRAATGLGAALPAALPGWTAEEVTTDTTGLALAGGGSQASRSYHDGGGQTVKIEITANSPLIAPLAMAMSNPAVAGAMGKLVRIGKERAIETSDGEFQMLIASRILVAITGDAPRDAKLAYARAIDFARIEAQ